MATTLETKVRRLLEHTRNRIANHHTTMDLTVLEKRLAGMLDSANTKFDPERRAEVRPGAER